MDSIAYWFNEFPNVPMNPLPNLAVYLFRSPTSFRTSHFSHLVLVMQDEHAAAEK